MKPVFFNKLSIKNALIGVLSVWLFTRFVLIGQKQDFVAQLSVTTENISNEDFAIDLYKNNAAIETIGKYQVHNNIIAGTESNHNSTVCICTQSSIDHLHWLHFTFENWNGPISLTLYAPGEDWPVGAAILNYLRRCSSGVRKYLNVHLVFSKEFPPLDEKLFIYDDCSNMSSVIKQWSKLRSDKFKKNYPQNLLRNIARKNCKTQYNLLLDVDIIPSTGMYEELQKFLDRQIYKESSKVAYVIPSFEIKENKRLPNNKQELMDLVKNKTAIPFYSTVSLNQQSATNYTRWYNTNKTNSTSIAYKVESPYYPYEPYYISSNSTPWYDERIQGFGCNRALQVYEMILLEYEFYVLDPIFLMHWKFHGFSSFPWYRIMEHINNVRIQDTIRDEMSNKTGK